MKFRSRRSSSTRAPGPRHSPRQSASWPQLPSSSSPVMDTVWIPSLMDTARRRVEFMYDNVVISDIGCDTGLYDNDGAVTRTDCASATAWVRIRTMPMRATTVRFSEDLWRLLEREAEREGVSAAQFIRDASVMRAAYAMGRRGEAGYEAVAQLGPTAATATAAAPRSATARRRSAPTRPAGSPRRPSAGAPSCSRRPPSARRCSRPPRRSRTPRGWRRCARPACSTPRPTPASTATPGSPPRCSTRPIALVSLVDEDRQFFKSCLGVERAARRRSRTPSASTPSRSASRWWSTTRASTRCSSTTRRSARWARSPTRACR